MSVLSILVAAIANFGLGMFWYSRRGFGVRWRTLGGQEADAQIPRQVAVIFSTASLLAAFALAVLLAAAGLSGWLEGLMFGVILGFGVVAMMLVPVMILDQQPRGLFLIHAGYAATGVAVMATIIGAG